jgi:hypothetical protein
LNGEDSFALYWLLRALADCPPFQFATEITEGYRRWWIGSFLDYFVHQPDIPREDRDEVTALLLRVLRIYDCGSSLPPSTYSLADFDFPVRPVDDADMNIAHWTWEEARLVIRVLQSVRDRWPVFASPPGSVGIGPETDDEWNEWVHQMIAKLLLLQDLKYHRPWVATFIA